jgi:hypothetical protein
MPQCYKSYMDRWKWGMDGGAHGTWGHEVWTIALKPAMFLGSPTRASKLSADKWRQVKNGPHRPPWVLECMFLSFWKAVECVLPKLISYHGFSCLPHVVLHRFTLCPEFFVQSQYSSHLYIIRPKGVPQTQLIDWLEDFKSTAHHKCRNGQ